MDRKSTTTIDYLEQMIATAESEKEKGYIQRVAELKGAIKSIKRMNKVKYEGGSKDEYYKSLKEEYK